MAKKNHKDKEAAAAADPAAAEETSTRLHETSKESGPQCGADLEEPEDPAVDQKSETQSVNRKWITELNSIADKVFARYPVQNALYFTADQCGFGSRSDAEAHASTLYDPTITEITRK